MISHFPSNSECTYERNEIPRPREFASVFLKKLRISYNTNSLFSLSSKYFGLEGGGILKRFHSIWLQSLGKIDWVMELIAKNAVKNVAFGRPLRECDRSSSHFLMTEISSFKLGVVFRT